MLRKSLSLPNKITLSYLEWNQGKEPLLLLHGLGDRGLVWLRLAEHLSEKYHIIAPDLRGHGDTSKPETGYKFEDIIEDLEGLIKHLGWSSFHLLGHSWGGKAILIWARKSPKLIRSLMLADPFFVGKIPGIFKITFPLLYRVLPALKEMGPFPSYEAAEKAAKAIYKYEGWNPLQQKVFAEGMEEKPDGSWGSKFTVAARNGIFEEVMKVDGLTEVLNVPTLFIRPEKGLNRSAWQMKPYYTYLKNLQVVEIPGHHWAFLVEPDLIQFNQVVEQFLEGKKEKGV